MPTPKRAITKHDVSLAEVRRKGDRELTIWSGVMRVAAIAAAALPIWALQGIVEPLAGHTTIVDVSIVASITAAASLTINGVQYAKGRSRSRELERQRERLRQLETGGGEA